MLSEKDKDYKDYEDVGGHIGRLVDSKNRAYGDSFSKSGEVLQLLYPNGVKCEQYNDMLAIIRIVDKLFRISKNKNAFSEDPYADICGYALLKVVENKNR